MSHGIVEATGWALDPATWTGRAACAGLNPGLFFPDRGTSTSEARQVCGRCPVQGACLDYALRWRIHFGIWGGLSERERRRLVYPARPARVNPRRECSDAECSCDACRQARRRSA